MIRSRSRSHIPTNQILRLRQKQPHFFLFDDCLSEECRQEEKTQDGNSESKNSAFDSRSASHLLPAPKLFLSSMAETGREGILTRLWNLLEAPRDMLQGRLGDLIQDGIAEGQRFALSSDLWRWTCPSSSKCELLLTIRVDQQPAHMQEFSKQVVVWIIDVFKKYAPQLKVEVRYHRLTNSYAFYLTANYLSLLKGAELCHLKKAVRPLNNQYLHRRLAGGMLHDFCVEQAHCFENIENKAEFLEGWERSLILKQMVDMVRAPKGGLKFKLLGQSEQVEKISNFQISEGRAVVSALRSLGVVEFMLPLHETHKLKWLRKKWVFAFFEPQPLEEIKEYFGTEISLYFAWLGHLTTALWAPAILGTLMFMLGGFKLNRLTHLEADDSDDSLLLSDICFVAFALFNCVWSTTYLELWKRRQAELAFKWGTYELHDDPLIDDPRPAFKGDSVAPNPITGRLEPTYPVWKNALIRYGLTYPATILCILLVLLVLFCMLQLQDITDLYFKKSPLYLRWITYVPMIVQALIIMVGDNCYRHLALFFNDLENYRTDEEYENFLISKIALFQSLSAFGSLFWIAFYLNDMYRLQETLATLLITRQLTQNLTEIAMPFLMEKLRLCKLTYKMTKTMSNHSLRRHVEAVRKRRDTSSELSCSNQDHPIADTCEESRIHYEGSGSDTSIASSPNHSPSRNSLWSSMRLRRSNVSNRSLRILNSLSKYGAPASIKSNTQKLPSTRLPLPEFCPNESDDFELTEAELQSLMTPYCRPLDDYLEMFIQFGYVLLFSPAFPLAALCALVNNLFEIRIDAFKVVVQKRARQLTVFFSTATTWVSFVGLCNAVQRPFARRVKTIGAWQKAMELMGTVGVMVNCALIGQSGLIERIWPDLSFGGQVVIVIVLEHFILATKMAVDMAIPDVPHWIQIETAKAEHWRREAYKRESKLLAKTNEEQNLASTNTTMTDKLSTRKEPNLPSINHPQSSPRQRSISNEEVVKRSVDNK